MKTHLTLCLQAWNADASHTQNLAKLAWLRRPRLCVPFGEPFVSALWRGLRHDYVSPSSCTSLSLCDRDALPFNRLIRNFKRNSACYEQQRRNFDRIELRRRSRGKDENSKRDRCSRADSVETLRTSKTSAFKQTFDPHLCPKPQKELVDQKWFGRELKVAWQEKVQKGNRKSICGLAEVFDQWAKENCDCYVAWQDVMHAFDIRNKIVHGATGTVSVHDGRTCINVFEVACDVLCDYVVKAGQLDSRSIFKRIVRYKGLEDAVEVAKSSSKKQKEREFAGASSDEILVEGVRVRVAKMDSITGGKVKPSLARKLFVFMRPFFKEW